MREPDGASSPASPPRSLSAVFPAHNEADNIAPTYEIAVQALDRLQRQGRLASFELIFVDDGSTDGTAAVARRLAAADPRVRLVCLSECQGYGGALRAGFAAASKDCIFFTDADCQFDMGEVGRLLEHIERYDFVAGRRRHRKDSLRRVAYSALYNAIIRACLGIPLRDINCAFKLFRRGSLEAVHLRSRGAFMSAELVARLLRAGKLYKEVDVTHYPRTRGRESGAALPVALRTVRELLSFLLGT